MEKKKAIQMLIARYRADASALERREEDLMRQIEILENLIPTVVMWHMSGAIQTREMMVPRSVVEESKTKLNELKISLRELQQALETVREEGAIVNARVDELEASLAASSDQHSDFIIDKPSYISRSEVLKVSYSEGSKERSKGFKDQKSERLTVSKNTEGSTIKHQTDKKIVGSGGTALKPDNLNIAKSSQQSIDSPLKKVRKSNVNSEKEGLDQGVELKELRQTEGTYVGQQTDNQDVAKIFHQSVDDPLKKVRKGNSEIEGLDQQVALKELKQTESTHVGQQTDTNISESGWNLPKPENLYMPRNFHQSALKSVEEEDFKVGMLKDPKLSSKELLKTEGIRPNSKQYYDNEIADVVTSVSSSGIAINSLYRSDDFNENERKYPCVVESVEKQRLNFDELLKSEETDWKQICEDLSQQVSKLSEKLDHCSQKLREREIHIKHLEEECSREKKELQETVRLLKKRTDAFILKVNEKGPDTFENDEEALYWKMQGFLRKTGVPVVKKSPTMSTTYQMTEGEGITPAYMQLAHWRFALKLSEYQGDRELKEKLMNGIKQGNMAPYYKEVCADLGWEFDSQLHEEMCAANVKRLEELEKEHENNVMDEEDQSQLCGVWQSKLDYLSSIGDSENASALANSKVDDKTVPKSHRIDAVFSLFRISFFHGCNIKGMGTAIEKATELIEGISGGDWSARNKLKAYEGVWSLTIRDFTRAAHLFVDVVPTFESYELADFGTIIRYTVLSCMIALPRCDLRKKLMLHGVMAQALHSQYQDLREYFVSLYDGRYSDFLICLARIEVEMKRDPLLHPHYRHYVQEMRLRAYKQILQAYRSLSLDYMAQSFGVTSEFIEREVARFAAAGRLQCKIDSVAGTVITSAHLDDSVRSKEAPEASLDRNILYQTTVKRGDILLNRLKKLARVMDF